MRQLTRSEILNYVDQGEQMPGPKYCRIDCTVPGVGVEVWATLIVMQAPGLGTRYGLEKIDASLKASGNPPLAETQAEVFDWLVQAVNAQPVGGRIREVLDAREAAEKTKSEYQRSVELEKAMAVIAAAEKRRLDSESA